MGEVICDLCDYRKSFLCDYRIPLCGLRFLFQRLDRNAQRLAKIVSHEVHELRPLVLRHFRKAYAVVFVAENLPRCLRDNGRCEASSFLHFFMQELGIDRTLEKVAVAAALSYYV